MMSWKQLIPAPVKAMLRPIYRRSERIELKHASELQYWERHFRAEGGKLSHARYQRTMLAMASEEDASFLEDKIVADFGCGPRGSLCWAQPARLRIGIDVLADHYMQFGIGTHNVCYVVSSENRIPLPSHYVDVLYTLNALDHVMHFEAICSEMLRILAPGGDFIGSFNLEEPPTASEPQTLTEDRLQSALLGHLEVISYRTAAQGEQGDVYRHFFDGSTPPRSGRRFLWVRARKAIGDDTAQ